MRRLVCSPALCVVLLAACTTPNPAFTASQGHLESSSSDSLSSTSAGGPGTSATADSTGGDSGSGTTVDLTGATQSATSDSDTSAATTATTAPVSTTDGTTSGTDGTDTQATDGDSTAGTTKNDTLVPNLDLGQPDLCSQEVAPNLEITVKHEPEPATCNAPFGPVIQGVLVGKPDANTFKFRACKATLDCIRGDTQCLANEVIDVHIDGPGTHIPKLAVGTCVSVAYVGDGPAGDNTTCKTRLVRFAKPANVNYMLSSIFVAAMGVPGTAALPAPWPEALEFVVETDQVQACGGNNVCGTPPGTYQLVGGFAGQTVVAAMKESKPAKIPLFDQNHDQVETILGSFYNLRSYANPVDQCEFRWLWLADAFKGP
ncbi:hypothetical protein [Nannocystis punicea]|uniref:Uncharacterized protein n=1 Tax=Nannocystis punicea TaxID=2995304 RepID=A0ABY7HGX4_9BACT|nr:hypothetical protein [Nannocystis poenicansa]WAS98563.1 hypothetical protein O0S08_20685 [Nannocystis poenicansa]